MACRPRARSPAIIPSIKVVVLTTYDADDWVFDAIRAGASGYLLKDSSSDEIVAAIEGAMAGEVTIDPAVAGKVLAEFNRLAWLDRLSLDPAICLAPTAWSSRN